MEDEIAKQYTNDEEIKEIVKLIKGKRIIRTEHFFIRIYQRDVEEEFIDEILPQFEKVKLIDKRKHKKGDIGYDLYYELSNSRTLKLCFILKGNKVLLVNAILRLRRWQSHLRLRRK
ncbi:hypothetical protein GOV13_02255 [Candidatus Pacearchaeota archaeon]|nr:hypothetical protein [Candidatus Pacearchaeota archaeon]